MTNIATPPKLQFFSDAGVPLAGGKVYTYAAGTTTPLATYTDSTGGTPNANPVILDSRGEASIWFGTSQYKLVLKTSTDQTIWTVDNLNGADMATYNAVLAALAASGGAALIGYLGAGTGATATTVQAALRNFIHVAQYGAVGNNTTDDYAAINNAITAASAAGVQLHFDGTKTYKIDQDTLTFPTGMNVKTNGCTFNFTKTMGTGATPAIIITGPFQGDQIKVTIPTGVRRNYGIAASGNDVICPLLSITSTDVQAQLAASTDYGVKLTNGARFQIGKIVVTNFDRAVTTQATTDSTVGSVDVTGYVRGYYSTNDTNLFVGKSNIKTASVNASNTAGHNGVLLGTTGGTNNTYEDFTVENAGEEGIRVAGGPQRNVMLVRPRVRNATANGIKVLGTDNSAPVTGELQQALFIIDPIIEDCGVSGGSDDRNGILIQRSVGVQVTNPIIRSRKTPVTAGSFVVGRNYRIATLGTTDFTLIGAASNTVGLNFNATGVGTGTGTAYVPSSVNCILISGSTDVLITNPLLQDAQWSGLYIAGTVGSSAVAADVTNVLVLGGVATANGTSGVRAVSTGATLRHIQIKGLHSYGNGTQGANIGGSGTFVNCFLGATFYQNDTSTIACTSTAWMMDCYGLESYGSSPTTFASISAQNSSRWSNGTSMYVLKAGTWTVV